MKAALALLALAYPVLAHLAIARQSPVLTVAAAAVLLLVATLPGMLARRAGAFVAAVAGAALLAWLASRAQAALLLYLPPVAINLFFAWLFGHTLAAGRMSLIERFVRIVHGDEALDPRIPPYARRLTAVWAALFVVLALVNALLALVASPGGVLLALGIVPPVTVPQATWSWCANVLNYVLVAVLFVAEYAWRRRVFPDQPYAHIGDFTRRVAAIGPRLWRELRAPVAR